MDPQLKMVHNFPVILRCLFKQTHPRWAKHPQQTLIFQAQKRWTWWQSIVSPSLWCILIQPDPFTESTGSMGKGDFRRQPGVNPRCFLGVLDVSLSMVKKRMFFLLEGGGKKFWYVYVENKKHGSNDGIFGGIRDFSPLIKWPIESGLEI